MYLIGIQIAKIEALSTRFTTTTFILLVFAIFDYYYVRSYVSVLHKLSRQPFKTVMIILISGELVEIPRV